MMPEHIRRLRSRHEGGRVVIVANGPSLNRMDLRFLQQEVTIGLNKIYLGLRRFRFYPRYVVAVNRRVIEQAHQEIAAMRCVKIIGERGADLIPEGPLTYHVATRNPSSRFSRDIEVGLHEGWTVTHAALQVAYYLGAREVVIVGMDHRFLFSGRPNESRTMKGSDPNHFSAEYFAGKTWDNPDLERSEESYRVAREVFEADGRRVIDATVDGACDVFEKFDYRSLFGI